MFAITFSVGVTLSILGSSCNSGAIRSGRHGLSDNGRSYERLLYSPARPQDRKRGVKLNQQLTPLQGLFALTYILRRAVVVVEYTSSEPVGN